MVVAIVEIMNVDEVGYPAVCIDSRWVVRRLRTSLTAL